MPTPLWIVNFAEKEPVESFFEVYWQAILQNTGQNSKVPLRWFHITDGSVVGDHREVINRIARRLTEDTVQDGRTLDKLIPSANQHDGRLNVIVTGDLTDGRTLEHFHTLAADLRAALLGDNPWSSVPVINVYGLLWRPNTVNFVPGVPKEAQAFLNELNTLMRLKDTNRRPFMNVFLFESSVRKEEKQDAMKAMAMAALHIALGHKPDVDAKFVNAGIAGMFYEKEVQKENEAFLLGNILLNAFARSKEPEFYDRKEAANYVMESCGDFLDSIQAKEIGQVITEGCPMPGQKAYAWDVKSDVSPFSLNLKEVWNRYYGDYLIHFKRNLVNNTKKGVFQYAVDYKTELFANQYRYIKEKAGELEDKVFGIFSAAVPSKVIGIQQGIAVLDLIHERVRQAADGLDTEHYQAFQLPDNLEKAYGQACHEHQTPADTMAVLEGKLKNHPVFVLSMLVRAVVLGFLLAYFGIFLIQFAVRKELVALDWFAGHPAVTGTLLFVLPVIWAFFRFNGYMARIKALKEQYVSCLLKKLQTELEEEIRKTVDKTYHELDEFCVWLKKNKLEFLQDTLSAIPPSGFSFTESACFQPILKCTMSDGTGDNRLLIPVTSVNGEHAWEVRLTGSFNGKDILEVSPLNHVTIQGNEYSLAKVETDSELCLKSKLVRELLKSEATVYSNVEKQVRFGKRTLPNTKLLILDVSGSMGGAALQELKQAVLRLSANTCIKWIAFNDNVVCTSEEGVDIMSLQASGGTCYIPPLEKAKELVEDCYIDQIILISDGKPFEMMEDILDKAYGLNQPVNVISIGDAGRDTMRVLAEKTGGTQIVVERASELESRLDNGLNVLLTAGDKGTFIFGDLLRKCHIPGCARALYNFSINRTASAELSIADLLVKYGNEEGLAEWGRIAGASCRYQQAGNRQGTLSSCKMVVDISEDELLKKLYGTVPGIVVEKLKGMPDMFAFLCCMEPVELSDLQWAGIPADCNLIVQKDKLMEYGVGMTEKAINIYGKEITMKTW